MAKHPEIKTPETDAKSPTGKDPKEERVTLVEALDKVLEKGAVVNGDLMIRVADVDLVYVGLKLILTSVSKAEQMAGTSFSNPDREATPEELEYLNELSNEIEKAEANIAKNIDAEHPKETEQGIAELVLTIVELIRRLMEKEAFRRVKSGNLSETEVQKLGMSLKAIEKKIKEIQTLFGIEDEDLNLDLGPLGDLM